MLLGQRLLGSEEYSGRTAHKRLVLVVVGASSALTDGVTLGYPLWSEM